MLQAVGVAWLQAAHMKESPHAAPLVMRAVPWSWRRRTSEARQDSPSQRLKSLKWMFVRGVQAQFSDEPQPRTNGFVSVKI